RHDEQNGNGTGTRIHRPVLADLAVRGRAARRRLLAEERLVIEERHRLSIVPAVGRAHRCAVSSAVRHHGHAATRGCLGRSGLVFTRDHASGERERNGEYEASVSHSSLRRWMLDLALWYDTRGAGGSVPGATVLHFIRRACKA